LKKRMYFLRNKKKRVIIGIETGITPGRIGAVVVEVSGSGNDTVLDLHGFRSRLFSPEVLATLDALERNEEFDTEEIAGINFLVLHDLSALCRDVLDEVGITPEGVDLIGLKCLELNGKTIPSDPSALSEMTGCIVASRFSIGVEDGYGGFLPVKEPILQSMVEEMIDRFGLDSEVREAVGVALLANESVFHENSETLDVVGGEGRGAERSSLRAVKRTSSSSSGAGKSCLCGEFFFPT
jgi:hypothetical protein